MNDYYSQFPQPPTHVRAMNLVDVMLRDDTFRVSFTYDELKDIATEVVQTSKEYSMTGYNVFGFAEERARMIESLKSKNMFKNIQEK